MQNCSVGGAEDRGPAPLSFTALVIAFLFADDPVSQWFQSYVAPTTPNQSSLTPARSISVEAILRSKNVRAETRPEHLKNAMAGLLPATTPLFSISARGMLEGANEFAQAEAGSQE